MKNKFAIDLVFILVISTVMSFLICEFYLRPSIMDQVPRIAILGIDREASFSEIYENPEKLKELAERLKEQGEDLSKQGFIVIDNASVVSAPEEYRAN